VTFPSATTESLLDVWRKANSTDYAYAIETFDEGRGFDPIVGQAAMLARVAEAVTTTTQAWFILPHSTQVAPPAEREDFARGPIDVRRAPPAVGPITLGFGSELVAMVHDVDGTWTEASHYRVESETTIAAGDAGPISLPLRALRVGYQGNVPAGRTMLFAPLGTLSIPGAVGAGNAFQDTPTTGVDRLTAGLVGRYVRIVGGPNAGTFPRRVVSIQLATSPALSSTIVLDGPALAPGAATVEVQELGDLGLGLELTQALTGGKHGWLDAMGAERLATRATSESDVAFRARIVDLADVVSPGAVVRTASRILTPLGISFRFVEAGDPEIFTGFAWGPNLIGTGVMGYPVSIDFATARRRFAIVVSGLGGQLDGTDTDVYLGATDRNDVDGDAYTDGYPFGWTAALLALVNAINQIKAAGIAWNILLDPSSF